MQKILITGGAGYIASHVVKQLLEKNRYKITIVDNLSTGSQKTLDSLRKIGDFEFVKLDLKEFDEVKKLLDKENLKLFYTLLQVLLCLSQLKIQ